MIPALTALDEAEEPFDRLPPQIDPATVRHVLLAIRAANGAQLAAADALYDELDLLVLPPPRAWELWQKMLEALIKAPPMIFVLPGGAARH